MVAVCWGVPYPCSLQAILHDVALLRATVGEPSSEREDGDFETGRTKVAEHLESKSVKRKDVRGALETYHVLRVELALYRHFG